MDDQTNVNTGPPQDGNNPVPDNATPPPPVAGDPASKETAANATKRPVPEDFGKLTKHRLPWGVTGVFIWLLLFSTGVLIPAEPSRKNLGWKSESETQANTKKLEDRVAELEKPAKSKQPDDEKDRKITGSTNPVKPEASIPPTPAPAAPPMPADTASQGTPPPNPDASKTLPKPKDPPNPSPSTDTDDAETKEGKATTRPDKFWSFLVATFTFTPLNVGFLCILAAFIGGCSVNKNEIHRIQQEIFDLEANPPVPPNPDITRLRQRLDYLTEHPGYSTIRGLVVYLIIISGLFIIGAPLTGENGTQSVTLGQYMKLAGLFSFFGYLSGYDPTVFSSVIGLGTKHLNTGKTGT